MRTFSKEPPGAVGMKGEVWRSPIARAAWVKQPSSTSLALNAVFIDEDEVIVGQSGVVLRNRIEQRYSGPQQLDFTSAVGSLLADGRTLRRLQNGVLELIDIPAVKLASGFGLIAATAPNSIHLSQDGVTWSSLR